MLQLLKLGYMLNLKAKYIWQKGFTKLTMPQQTWENLVEDTSLHQPQKFIDEAKKNKKQVKKIM